MLVTRTAWDDWYADGDRSAVFVNGNVMVLSVLATAVLRHVGVPVGIAVLADLLTEEFGTPEGGDTLAATRAVVDELIVRGVLAKE